ncbi:MAG: hypothetical protein QGG40_11700, partial [Myxococcota bacterium]|nr:hypothetical protein [Myxococcota bacterium]
MTTATRQHSELSRPKKLLFGIGTALSLLLLGEFIANAMLGPPPEDDLWRKVLQCSLTTQEGRSWIDCGQPNDTLLSVDLTERDRPVVVFLGGSSVQDA